MAVATDVQPGIRSQSRPSKLVRLYPWLLMAVLVTAAALLRFHALGAKSVWIDEGVSIEMARLDWYNFLRILWRHEANMVLHTLLLRFWLQFGHSEAWLRIPSVLAGLATVPALFILGRKLFDARVGLMASFLLTINAFHIRYSQEARSYALFAFLSVLSSFYFLKWLENPTPSNRRAHVLSSALAVYTHFFAGFLVLSQWLSLKLLDDHTFEIKFRKNVKQFAIAILPLVVFVATTGLGVLRWIPRPDKTSIYIVSVFLTGRGGNKLLWLYIAACVAALLPAMIVWLRGKKLVFRDWRYVFLAIWLLFPIAAVFLISQWKPCFLARYFIFTLPALALLSAAGIARLRWTWLMGIALLLFAALSMPGVYEGYKNDVDRVREDFRSATNYVLVHAHPGDAILFYQPIARMPYQYYCSITPSAAYPVVIYPASGDRLTFRDFYAGRPPERLLADVPAQYRRVWVLFTHNMLPSGPDQTTRFISDLYARKYEEVHQSKFQEIELRVYEGNNKGRE